MIHIFVLFAMAGQFSSFAAEQKPVGIRTAIELMDRKWLKVAVHSPATRSIENAEA